ncbi:hypothetical protein ACU686_12855 [Yinghuangia aomiensis]
MSDATPPVRRTTISLPAEVLARLEADREAGVIDSVSGHITDVLKRDQAAADVRGVLAKLFPDDTTTTDHERWARAALGVPAEDSSSAA